VKRSVRLTARAQQDLHRLELFLIDKNPEAADRAVAVLTQAILSLADHAERGFPGPLPNLKQIAVPFGDSGYIVQYRIQGETVIVAHLKHAREQR
jgi:plasmid stabilization system protein ParE